MTVMATAAHIASLSVTSPAFKDKDPIPAKYTCQGQNVNPPLAIGNIPEGTKSLVLIIEDPDAPGATFNHWVVWNIPPTGSIEENSAPGVQGSNSAGKNSYMGPCPPSGSHRYFFKTYALDTMLDLPPGSDKKAVEKAMKDHVLAEGTLMGVYEKAS
jgi:Raf kinase inhibitor-like YbhB/YbcL family protein